MAVENANWNAPLEGFKYWKYWLRRSIANRVPAIWRRRIKRYRMPSLPSVYKKCIIEQFENCELLNDYLELPAIQRSLGSCGRGQIETLFTITSAIEELVTGESSIENCSDGAFY
jgi:hypothetical protein